MSVAKTVFVTGTDTEIGKTYVTTGLLQEAKKSGRRWRGFKPIAAGAEQTPEGLRNEDALALIKASAEPALDYDLINPLCYEPAIAPHIAAQQSNQPASWSKISAAHRAVSEDCELVLAEGAGGWLVPFNEEFTMADKVCEADWPVILVVGMRLGCINHALLTAQSIQSRARLLGWVANCLPPMQTVCEENIKTLSERVSAPLLGRVTTDPLSFESLYEGFSAACKGL